MRGGQLQAFFEYIQHPLENWLLFTPYVQLDAIANINTLSGTFRPPQLPFAAYRSSG